MRSAGALLMLVIVLAACGDERAAQTRERTKPARRTRLHANALVAQAPSLATRLPAPREITFQGTSLADWAERLDEYDVEGAADARRRLEGLSEDDLRATLSLAFQSVLGIDSDADTYSAEIVVQALVQRLVPDLVALSRHELPDVRWQAIELLAYAIDTPGIQDAARSAILDAYDDEDVIAIADETFSQGMFTEPTPAWAVPRLVAYLDSDRATTRNTAAVRLGYARHLTFEQIAKLVSLLGHEDEDTVESAYDACVGQDHRALPALLDALDAESVPFRVAIAETLGGLTITDERKTAALIPLLGDPSPDVRGAAAYALRETEGVVNAIPRLIAMLRSDEPLDRAPAAAALTLAGYHGGDITAALDDLAAGAKDMEDVDLRTNALEALAYAGPRTEIAVNALLEGLVDDPRVEALATLREIGSEFVLRVAPSAPDAFVELLGDSDHEIRRSAAHTLEGYVGTRPEFVTALIEAFTDENRSVRRAALRALGECKTSIERVLPIVCSVFDVDNNAALIPDALYTLEALGTSAAPALDDLAVMVHAGRASDDYQIAEALPRALVAVDASGERSGPLLIAIFEQDPSYAGTHAIAALSKIPPTETTFAALVGAVDRAEWNYFVTSAVRNVLVAYGDASVPIVLQALAHANPHVRRAMVYVIPDVPLPDKRIVSLVIRGLDDPDAGVRSDAAMALADMGERAASAAAELSVAIGDRDEGVRIEAARALHATTGNTAAAVPILVAALDSEEYAFSAISALGLLKHDARRAVPALIRAVERWCDDDFQMMALADAFTEIGTETPEVAAAFERALTRLLRRPPDPPSCIVSEGPEVIPRMVLLLGVLGYASSKTVLSEVADHRGGAYRQAAQDALAKLRSTQD